MELCSLAKLAAIFRESVVTLRRWNRNGCLVPSCRTIGGHRRYNVEKIYTCLNAEVREVRKTVAYVCISPTDESEYLLTEGQ